MINETIDWFANSGNASFMAFLVSVGSIIIAGIALVISFKTQRRQLKIEEKRENDRIKEMRKANLVAQLVTRSSKSSDYLLRIENKGSAEARDVRISLDGSPIQNHAAIPRGFTTKNVREMVDGQSPKIQHTSEETYQIGPESYIQFIMAITSDTYPPFDLTMTWSDDSGEPGYYRHTITF